jgi:L-threonine-O-3-phosphate decarboxylase
MTPAPPRRLAPEPRREGPAVVAHGGPDHAELARLGVRPDELLDFSVNTNPLGASPLALQAINTVDPSRYPDSQALRLRTSLAAFHGVGPEQVVAGNGSVELIWRLAEVFLDRGDSGLIVGPTFGEYEAAIRRQNASVAVFRASPSECFQPRLEDLLAFVQKARPRLMFVCNPNNPTGQALEAGALQALLGACGETLVVIDEAYIDFADGLSSALALQADSRVVVLRSLTKNFGLAGLRLGYVVATPGVVGLLQRAQPPWSVNAFAQAAGLAALDDREHLETGRRLAVEAREYLLQGVARLGLSGLPSRTNFCLVEVGDASRLRADLLSRGILVRDCASFGLPRYIRLAARPLPECERLLEALSALV